MLKYPLNRSCTSGWRRHVLRLLLLLALGGGSAASAEKPRAQEARDGGPAAAPGAAVPPAAVPSAAVPSAAVPPAAVVQAPPADVPPAAVVQAPPAAVPDPSANAELATFNDPPPGGTGAPSDGVQPTLPGAPRLYGRRDAFMRLRVDGHVALTWGGAFGVGMRADFPLISGTFRYSNRDELAISAGGDVTFVSFNGSRVVEVFPTATLQWSLSVNERAYFFPELGIVGHVDGGRWDGLHPNFGFGGRYYLRRSFSLQGRLGWPIAFAGGVTF